jgi:hypothetical protein
MNYSARIMHPSWYGGKPVANHQSAPGEGANRMFELIGIILLIVIVFAAVPRRNSFKEIERRQAVQRSLAKIQEKNRRFSL